MASRRRAIGRHFLQLGQRDGAERLLLVGARDVDDVLVAAGRLRPADDQLGRARLRPRVDAAVAERAEEPDPLRIARLAEDGDGRLAPIGVVTREVRQARGRFPAIAQAEPRGPPRERRATRSAKESSETVSHAFF